jgi:hypothetical protein
LESLQKKEKGHDTKVLEILSSELFQVFQCFGKQSPYIGRNQFSTVSE